MDALEILEILDSAPFGLLIYTPVLEDDELRDLTLNWANVAISRFTGLPLQLLIGHQLSDYSEHSWDDLRVRFAKIIADGGSFDYSRRWSDPRRDATGTAYQATAWFADPLVCVLMYESTDKALSINSTEDIAEAKALLEARAENTQKLAVFLKKLQDQIL